MIDSVVVGSIAAVAVSAGIIVYLVFKIKALMSKDAEAHKK
jgi:D-serine dehydratase